MASITIKGPVSCGKSFLLDVIARILEERFNCTVASSTLFKERNLGLDSTRVEESDLKAIRSVNWVLEEQITVTADQLTDPSIFPIVVQRQNEDQPEVVLQLTELTNEGEFKILATHVKIPI